MISFPHPKITKADLLVDLRAHYAADRIIKDTYYWKDGKGCAVGCSLESVSARLDDGTISHRQHSLYETYLGIPQVLARLEDRIFEGLPNEMAQSWPLRFIEAVPVGVDLTMVWPRFALWLLSEEVPQHTTEVSSLTSLADVAALYREWVAGTKPSYERWIKACDTAYAVEVETTAAYVAAYAADVYVYTAYASGPHHAAEAIAYAAMATDDAGAYYVRMSTKLLEIISAV